MTATLTTVSGGTVDFSDEQIAELGMMFRGSIYGASDSGYDELRVIENLAIDRRPGRKRLLQVEGVVLDGLAEDRVDRRGGPHLDRLRQATERGLGGVGPGAVGLGVALLAWAILVVSTEVNLPG